MRTLILFGTLLFFPLSAYGDLWDDLLKQGDLTKDQVRFDELDLALFAGTELKIPGYLPLHSDPLRIPAYAQILREACLRSAEKPEDLAQIMLTRIGLGIRRGINGDPLADLEERVKKADPLLFAIARTYEAVGKRLPLSAVPSLRKQIKTLEPEIVPLAAYLIEATVHAYQWRQRALANLPPGLLSKAFEERRNAAVESSEANVASPTLRKLIQNVDFSQLMVGAYDLVHAVETAKLRLMGRRTTAKTVGELDWRTPLGRVVIHTGPEKNTYPARVPYLLILDEAGDDTYYGGGGSFSADLPIGLLIDAAGNDQYLADSDLLTNAVGPQAERRSKTEIPRFGAGLFGYGILVDLAGDDHYAAYRSTQGAADFGLGLLWDIAGKDRYECWSQCQGAAEFGAGLLIDNGGSDQYLTFAQAQGFAGLLGTGLLLDSGAEGDQYLANNEQIDFPAIVDSKFNTSFVQGAATGMRADFSDGHSYAGGYAALIDAGGDNTFRAGFFAQGVGYWYGVGVLSVGNGNDTYDAGKYAQGASAHFGVGVLHDRGGNDRYHVHQELGLGEGHDYGVGFFLDEAGDDSYDAPNLSLGCASGQGIGFFWDRQGNDTYRSTQPEILGCASLRMPNVPTFRTRNLTLGVFLDSGPGTNEFATALNVPKGKLGSAAWRHDPSALPPEKLPAEALKRLVAIGRVADQAEVPFPR